MAGEGWTSGTWTTGYWDCCKPSCSWPNKGNVNKPTLSCVAKTGERLLDSNVNSVCKGGTAAACADNAPFLVQEGLSMGFAAAAVGGGHGLSGDENCGQCYELHFTETIHPGDNWGGSHPDLVGKRMIVQVTNIGYDVNGEHSFDIQIPGAGQGAFTNGCTAQFDGYESGDFDCDNNYGGCHNKTGCSRLPAELQPACEWRYDWYRWLVTGGQTNNPYVDFRRVQCPSELTDISGSVPNDDAEYPAFQQSAPTPLPQPTVHFTADPTPATTHPTPPPTVQPTPQPTVHFTATPPSVSCSAVHDQCGGIDWTGPTCCSGSHVCTWQNDWYSQCL